ncbi:MAG: cupin domain-containing protein [Myxococcota bacterium]
MSRPFIEFLQSQLLHWQTGLYGGGFADVRSKVLSLDGESGASSTIVQFPPEFNLAGPFHLRVDQELFVLAGDLDIDGYKHRRYTYAHLPAGFEHTHVRSEGGAVVLAFYSGEPRLHDGTAPIGMYDEARAVPFVNAFDGDWEGNFHPLFPPGAGRKFLRRDPHDGEETWVLGTMPLRWGHRREKHPVVEEMYLLSGELVGHRGRMHAGSYFWRPPDEWHGPFGSPTGNLMLFRTKGGPLSTVYEENVVPFDWDQPYRPILPDDLEEVRSASFDGACRCY